MLESRNTPLHLRVLVIDDDPDSHVKAREPLAYLRKRNDRVPIFLMAERQESAKRALRDWDRRFPGFGHDTHGIETRDGVQYMQCLQRSAAIAETTATTTATKAAPKRKAGGTP